MITGIDIWVYILVNASLLMFAVLALKVWNYMGLIGGFIGILLSMYVMDAENLTIYTVYDETASAWVYQYYPMGFFAFIPVVLTVLNLVLIFLKK